MVFIWLAIALIGFITLAIILFFALKMKKRKDEIFKETGKHPEGYYRGIWMSTWLAIGVAMGIALDALPIGIGVGLAIGLAIGQREEEKHKDELRPLTEEEKRMDEKSIVLILGLLLMGIIFAATLFLLG